MACLYAVIPSLPLKYMTSFLNMDRKGILVWLCQHLH